MPDAPAPRPAWLLHILESKHTFKAVASIYFLIIFGAIFGLFNLVTDDPQIFRDFGVLIVVLVVFVAGMLAHISLRALGADVPLYEERRLKVMLFTGFGAAFLLALLLSIYNHNGTVIERKSAENNRAQREMLGGYSK
jgi:hypothetical protein